MSPHRLDYVAAELGLPVDDPRIVALKRVYDAACEARFFAYSDSERAFAGIAKLLPDDVLVVCVNAEDPDPVVAQDEPRATLERRTADPLPEQIRAGTGLPDAALTSRQRAARYREQDKQAFKAALDGVDLLAVKDALARSGRGYSARTCDDGMIEVLDTSGTPMVRCAASQALDMVARLAPQRTALIGAYDA